jgi:hypothetical protein
MTQFLAREGMRPRRDAVHLGGTLQEIGHSERDVWEDSIHGIRLRLLCSPACFRLDTRSGR